jgi:hypothetical protein
MASGMSERVPGDAAEGLGATLVARAGRIAALVKRVRLRMVAVALAAGLLLTLALAIAWVVGGVLLDLAAPLSVPLRLAVFAGFVAVVAAACAAFLLLPAWRRPLLDGVALAIERALGGMHNRLLTVVDLARGGGRAAATRRLEPHMVERLLEQTQALLAGFRPSAVIRWRALLRNLLLVIGGLAAVAGMYAGLGERLLVTLERLRNPTADIPPATFLQLRSPGDVEVLEGEALTITGTVVRGETAAADLVVYDASGRATRYPMRTAADGGFAATLDGVSAAARYRIEGGGTWTKTHAIGVLHRPEIHAVRPRIVLPAYMRIDATVPVDPEARRIEAPLGSTLEFQADVSSDVVSGAVNLFGRRIETRSVERFDERVWFEDELPRDAVEEQPWRWTTAHAAGGLRAFTFGHDGGRFGMRTRLEPLVMPREQIASRAVMVMARLDPADPPGRLAMLLEVEGGRTELVWGDASSAPPAQGFTRVVVGPLPTPGAWARLSKPLGELPQLVGRTVGAVSFSIDRGRVLLDRPGWVETSTETVSEPVDHPSGSLAMKPDESAATTATGAAPATVAAAGGGADTAGRGHATWTGGVPVAAPTWAALEFRSREGHPTLPQAPVEIVPTVDKPPALIVEDPPEVLTLEVADDLPLRGRGFDDWGIDAVLVRIGPDPARLGEPEPIPGITPAVRPPDTLLPFDVFLSAERLGLGPGRSAAFTILVRDTKGQVTETKPFVVSVVLPPEHALAKLGVPGLEQARREAEQAAKNAARKAEAMQEKREQVLEAVGREPLAALDAAEEKAREAAEQGKAAEQDKNDQAAKAAHEEAREAAKQAAQEAQKTAEQAVRRLDNPRRSDLAQLDAELEQRARDAEKLSKAVEQAAAQAARNPLVPTRQQEKLAELAKDARELAESLDKDDLFKGEAAKLDRVADAPEAADLAKETERLAEALEQVEQEIDAAGASRRLESLVQDLDRRATQLAQAEAAREAAREPRDAAAAPNDPATPTQRQQAQRQADAAAREQVRQLEQILGRPARPQESPAAEAAATEKMPADAAANPPPTDAAQAAAAKPDAGAPDGSKSEAGKPDASPPDAAKPEAGKPESAKPNNSKPDAAQPDSTPPAADNPAAGPQDSPAAKPAAPKPADPVSRALLEALAAAGETARATETLADKLGGRTPLESPAPTPADGAAAGDQPPAPAGKGEPAAAAAAATPAADPGADDPPADSARAAAIADLLASRDVQQALAMAERSRRLAAQAAREAAAQARREQQQQQQQQQGLARQPGQGDEPGDDEPRDQNPPEGTEGGAMAGRTAIQSGDPLRGLDAARRAAIYKLPPRVRDPLLEGMRQKGPAAYQDVIDTYFRQLGRDIPQ